MFLALGKTIPNERIFSREAALGSEALSSEALPGHRPMYESWTAGRAALYREVACFVALCRWISQGAVTYLVQLIQRRFGITLASGSLRLVE